eukprot:Opistho-2@11941
MQFSRDRTHTSLFSRSPDNRHLVTARLGTPQHLRSCVISSRAVPSQVRQCRQEYCGRSPRMSCGPSATLMSSIFRAVTIGSLIFPCVRAARASTRSANFTMRQDRKTLLALTLAHRRQLQNPTQRRRRMPRQSPLQQLGAEEMAAPMNAWELARRHTVIHNSGRLFVPHRRPLLGRHGDWQSRRIAPNDVFDKIYVMNLDRRQDRWESVVSQTKRIGLGVHRFSAVDGYASPHKEEWDAYSRQPIVPHPEGRMGVRSVRFGSEYELDYDSTVARVAFMENRLQQKVLKTPGAWGYAKTYAAILKDAISSGHDRILILDDDSLFHRNFTDLFDIMYREVPADWKVLQLGSMQYSWNNKHVQWVGPHLYMNWGTGVGSHAVGIDRSVFLEMLALSTRPTMPVDEGALHTVVRKHPLHCFVAFPNLIVQNSMLASDINSSVASEEDRRGKNWDKFKWTREDYEDMDASTSGGATTRDNATVTQ